MKSKIERLDFVLPEFPVRLSWVSQNERTYWEPKIKRIQEAWNEVERQRESSIQFVEEDGLILFIKQCSKEGKIVIPLSKEGISPGYGNSIGYTEGQPYRYRVAVTNVENVKFWTKELSDREMGRLLGYPDCCISFFEKYWVEEKFLDLTFLQALNSGYLEKRNNIIQIGTGTKNNVLLRWLGIRLVSHMPCSFNCSSTWDIASKNYIKFPEEEGIWIRDLLSLPIKWSALHGIAEVKTPLFKFIARTDATGEEYIVEVNGTVKDVPVVKKEVEDIWSDNGFYSKELMDEAHKKLLVQANIKDEKHILDLGCGNGALLAKLPKDVHKYGVDISADKIEKCAQRFYNHNTFAAGYITDFQWDCRNYDAIFVSINRITECPIEKKNDLFRLLYARTKKLILYSYDYKNWDTPKGFDSWPYKGFQIDGVRVFEHD